MPYVVFLLEQINRASSTWYEAIDLGNVLFSIPVRKENRNNSQSHGTDKSIPLQFCHRPLVTFHPLS